MKITKAVVEGLSIPDSGYTLLWDNTLKGFGIRITANGVKSFILQYRALGKSRRATLGRYGYITVEQARKRATVYLGEVAAGQDPLAVKAKREVEVITLGEVFNTYLEVRDLKPRTVRDMQEALKGVNDWMNKPLVNITRDMVAKRHRQLGLRSKGRANLTMRYLRALFNFAVGRFTDTEGKALINDNPVRMLSDTRAWYRLQRRQTVIKSHQLKPWMEALLSLKNESVLPTTETICDFLMLILLTGLRRHEAETLSWDQVDLEGRTLTILDTKNRQDHTLPLSDYLFDMLSRRKSGAVNGYVFPGSMGKGHILEPRKAMNRITETSGVKFCIHDLRRTFATVADSLDIPGYAVKMLLNHKISGDITAGYIIPDVERLREPMQRITDHMLSMGGVTPSNSN